MSLNRFRAFSIPWVHSRGPVDPPAARIRAQGGLTLMEVVVATAIFSVTIVSLLVLRDRAIDQTSRAKNIRIARRLAQQILEEIRSGKEYKTGARDAFDLDVYPGFYWHVKEAEPVELLDPEEEEGPKGLGKNKEQPPPGGPGGLAALLGAGKGEDLKRYVLEIAYPAPTEEGFKTFEVVTYHLMEADPKALAKALGGGLGGAAGGDGGAGGLLQGAAGR